VHSHSKRIFTHIHAYSRIFTRRCREERHVHSAQSIKSACCQKRAFSLVSCIFSSSTHIRIFTRAPHVHMHTWTPCAYSRGSAHIHAEALAQTADFPSLLEQQNDLVKFACQIARIPSLLKQQNDLVKFTCQTAQIPSQLKQQNDLCDFHTRRNTRKKPSQLTQQNDLSNFS
jgi:hypothetical protein